MGKPKGFELDKIGHNSRSALTQGNEQPSAQNTYTPLWLWIQHLDAFLSGVCAA